MGSLTRRCLLLASLLTFCRATPSQRQVTDFGPTLRGIYAVNVLQGRQTSSCPDGFEQCFQRCTPVGAICCNDGSGSYCAAGTRCTVGSNGEGSCCPLGERCEGPGGTSTHHIIAKATTTLTASSTTSVTPDMTGTTDSVPLTASTPLSSLSPISTFSLSVPYFPTAPNPLPSFNASSNRLPPYPIPTPVGSNMTNSTFPSPPYNYTGPLGTGVGAAPPMYTGAAHAVKPLSLIPYVAAGAVLKALLL